MAELKISEIILPSFYDFWKARRSNDYTFYVCKGGRNSAKSTHISIGLVFDLIDLPITGLVVRKVGNTISGSVYEQLKEATEILGVSHLFSFTKAPNLSITYKIRGNGFIFRGADEPDKIKSIKQSKFPIARLWIEELTEFKMESEVQTIVDSVLRAELPDGIRYKIFYSYNPPKRKQHWANKKYESAFVSKNTYIHTSTYLTNPKLSSQALEDIEIIKERNIQEYNWNYLGIPTGGGVVPFDNLVFRPIAEEEIKSFDNIRQGIDWGYASDPFCFGRMHYDKTRRKLYFIDEIYGVKLSNREVAGKILSKGYQDIVTIADSAEPKSIAELKEYGVRIIPAKKGQGSVEYGEKWLDDLTEIIIDPVRTPNIATEFENIDYMVDRFGQTQPKLEDKDNHSIDMSRYACENDMNKEGFYSLSNKII